MSPQEGRFIVDILDSYSNVSIGNAVFRAFFAVHDYRCKMRVFVRGFGGFCGLLYMGCDL